MRCAQEAETAPGFDLWAPTYASDAEELGWAAPQQAAALLAPLLPALAARRPTPLRGLDAGCGTGLMAPLWREMGVTEVVGLDLSLGMLEEARQLQFYQQLLHAPLDEPLPLADSAVDVIACVGVLSYVRPEARGAALAEFIRLSSVGGLVAFSHRTDYLYAYRPPHECSTEAKPCCWAAQGGSGLG